MKKYGKVVKAKEKVTSWCEKYKVELMVYGVLACNVAIGFIGGYLCGIDKSVHDIGPLFDIYKDVPKNVDYRVFKPTNKIFDGAKHPWYLMISDEDYKTMSNK